jgi:RNA-directed DNA polymerase
MGKYRSRLNFDGPLDRWVFGSKQTGSYPLKYRWFRIQPHTLVKGYASPDDPNEGLLTTASTGESQI